MTDNPSIAHLATGFVGFVIITGGFIRDYIDNIRHHADDYVYYSYKVSEYQEQVQTEA
ncbi:hypothetical protein HYX12_00160 [Candidatus Woesearchaeota archaeon]|nr:hypothetical protein [Candidatus Woesearchaeota archaeon]